MNLTNTKILVGCLFGIVRFFFGVLPIKIYKKWIRKDGDSGIKGTFVNEKRHNQIFCGLIMFQAFGGGVIFAMCFLHMIPEVYESTIQLKKYGLIHTKYPFSQLIVSLGFFIVYFIEELAQYFISISPNEKIFRESTPKNKVVPENADAVTIIDEDEVNEKELEANGQKAIEYNVDEKSEDVPDNPDEKENGLNLEKTTEMEQVEELDQLMEVKSLTQQQFVRGLLIILALSMHAFFEGLAVGLQTSQANIWYLFLAVSIHSATILFCLSLELLLAGARIRTIVVHVSILSIMSPLGVFLGLLITINADMNTKIKSIGVTLLEGLSAGTILYITFFEVLNREKERRKCRLSRAFCIIFGFAMMACLETMEMYY